MNGKKKNIRNGKKKNIRNGKRETPGTGSLKRKKAIKREPYDLRMMTDDMIRTGSRMTDIITPGMKTERKKAGQTMNLVRKCKNCGNWIYIIEKEPGDLIRCVNCGEEHHLTKTLSDKYVLTRIRISEDRKRKKDRTGPSGTGKPGYGRIPDAEKHRIRLRNENRYMKV